MYPLRNLPRTSAICPEPEPSIWQETAFVLQYSLAFCVSRLPRGINILENGVYVR